MIYGYTLPTSEITRVTFAPINYTVANNKLTTHLQAIDQKLSGISFEPPPLKIEVGQSYKVAINTQILYALNITIDGELILDGALIEV